MLSGNIKNIRKAKGLTQEELAVKLNVVRQTVSKWEKGLSVPDSEMLIRVAEELETSVNVLLGETIKPDNDSEIEAIAKKLTIINEHIAKHSKLRRKVLRTFFIIAFIVATCVALGALIGVIYFQIVNNEINTNTSIIGGYDGPTNIFVAITEFRFVPFILSFLLAVVSFVGIYKTSKK